MNTPPDDPLSRAELCRTRPPRSKPRWWLTITLAMLLPAALGFIATRHVLNGDFLKPKPPVSPSLSPAERETKIARLRQQVAAQTQRVEALKSAAHAQEAKALATETQTLRRLRRELTQLELSDPAPPDADEKKSGK